MPSTTRPSQGSVPSTTSTLHHDDDDSNNHNTTDHCCSSTQTQQVPSRSSRSQQLTTVLSTLRQCDTSSNKTQSRTLRRKRATRKRTTSHSQQSTSAPSTAPHFGLVDDNYDNDLQHAMELSLQEQSQPNVLWQHAEKYFGARYRQVTGDGNCVFYCMNLALGRPDDHRNSVELRRELVEYARNNQTKIWPDDSPLDTEKYKTVDVVCITQTSTHLLHSIIYIYVLTSIAWAFSQYCDTMLKDYEYGDETMLRAFAHRYHKRVHVYQIGHDTSVSLYATFSRFTGPRRREDPLMTIVRNPVVLHYNFITPEST